MILCSSTTTSSPLSKQLSERTALARNKGIHDDSDFQGNHCANNHNTRVCTGGCSDCSCDDGNISLPRLRSSFSSCSTRSDTTENCFHSSPAALTYRRSRSGSSVSGSTTSFGYDSKNKNFNGSGSDSDNEQDSVLTTHHHRGPCHKMGSNSDTFRSTPTTDLFLQVLSRTIMTATTLTMSSKATGNESKQKTQSRKRSRSKKLVDSWIPQIWILHFVIGTLILAYSVWTNRGKSKYIPVDPIHSSGVSGFEELSHCHKAYVNSLAAAPSEPGAVICCAFAEDHHVTTSTLTSSNALTRIHYDEDSSIFGLCPPNPSSQEQESSFTFLYAIWNYLFDTSSSSSTYLPFLNRLTKFPDALVIPLFPLLMRMMFRTCQTFISGSKPFVLDTTFGVYSFRRLVFYFLLMQFRGWILYVALNHLEDTYFVNSSHLHANAFQDTTNQYYDMVFDEEHQRHQNYITENNHSHISDSYMGNRNSATKTCWYGQWLQETQPSCHGRRFDFSDHIVLYFAQLLPIALLEYIHSLDQPYWNQSSKMVLPNFLRPQCFSIPGALTMRLMLTGGMLYLYFITFVGLYKTALYFHTPQECLVGFSVSLLAQVPLCVLQCSNRIEPLVKLREFLFGNHHNSQIP